MSPYLIHTSGKLMHLFLDVLKMLILLAKSTKQESSVSDSIPRSDSMSKSALIDVKSTKMDHSLSKSLPIGVPRSLPNGKSRKRERSPHDNTPHNDIQTKVTKDTKGTSGNNDSEEVIGMSRDEVKREVEEFVIKKVGEGMKEKKVEYTHARKKGRDRIYKPLKREGKPIIIEEWEIEWEILKDYRAKNGVKSGRISIDVLKRMKKQ